MSPFDAATIWYGSTCLARPTSSDSYLRPIRRLMAKTVLKGLVMACRLAICPTRRSLSSVKPTTDGVVRLPSRLGITCGVVTSTTATQELVVPRSMPMIVDMPGLRYGNRFLTSSGAPARDAERRAARHPTARSLATLGMTGDDHSGPPTATFTSAG